MNKNEISELMDQLYVQAKIQFGRVVKGRWFYDRDNCPGCCGKVTAGKHKGQETISINTFIFREHGVLIVYLLCGKCGKKVIKATTDTPLHTEIEKNLKKAFLSQLGH